MAAPAGAVSELIDEVAVQHGRGLEAAREREANEQLRAEVCPMNLCRTLLLNA